MSKTYRYTISLREIDARIRRQSTKPGRPQTTKKGAKGYDRQRDKRSQERVAHG